MSGASGGTYAQGLLSGALGSIIGSGAGSLLQNSGAGLQAAGTVSAGALAGGIGAKIMGGNFWDGARNGAISAGLNHAIHTGVFGEGILWSSLTGEIRHLFGQDANVGTLSLNGSSGVNVGVETGAIEILRGNDKGIHPITDVSTGIGGVEVTLTVELMKLYYSGSLKTLTLDKFYGPRYELNVGLADIIAGGITAIYSPVAKGEYVFGYGAGIGIGVSPIGYFNVNYGASGKNPQHIRNILMDLYE